MADGLYTTACERAFPKGTKVELVGGGVRFTFQCKHGHEVAESYDMRMPPDKAKKHLTNKGWRFWGKKTCCPEHNAKPAQKPKPKEKETEVEVPSNVVEMAAKAAPPANDASKSAKSAKRAALQWIEELFDEGKGRYKIGFSDAYVAKETGLSIDAVAKLREDFGFEIKEPVEFAQWRLELEALERNIASVKSGVEEKIEKLRDDGAEMVKALTLQASKLREKIEATIKEKGW